MGAFVLATCLTKEGEQGLKSVTSDKLKTFQMDVTNSQQIKDVYSEVKKEISSGTLQTVFISCAHVSKSQSLIVIVKYPIILAEFIRNSTFYTGKGRGGWFLQ